MSSCVESHSTHLHQVGMAAAAASAASAAVSRTATTTSSLINRAVHIKIPPPPINVAETRSILRKLENRFGAVEMFRHLKVCLFPSHSHSTLSTTIDADEMISYSTIRISARRTRRWRFSGLERLLDGRFRLGG